MPLIRSTLDFLIATLGVLCLGMWLTGGTILELGRGKLEFSTLDPWMLVFCLLLALRWDAHRERAHRIVAALTEPARAAKIALTLLIAISLMLFAGHSLRHLSFSTDAFDTTFLHQPLFAPGSLGSLHCDLCDGRTYLGEHLAYTLYLVRPLTRALGDWVLRDHLVFLLEILLVSLPLWATLKAGPLRRDRELWFFAILIVFCSRSLRNSMVWDFREDHLAFAFLLTASAALLRGWSAAYMLSLLGALLSKENVGLVAAFLAVPLLLDPSVSLAPKRKAFLAMVTVALSLGWTVVAFKWLIPRYSPSNETNEIVARLGQYGDTPGEILRTLLLSPSAWLEILRDRVFSLEAAKYIVLLVGPFAMLLLKASAWIAPALPGLAMNLISAASTQRSLQFHYDLIILPFLILGAWRGLAILNENTRSDPRLKRQTLLIAALIALTLSGRWPGLQIQQNWPSLNEARDAIFLSRIREDEAIAAPLRVLPHLGSNRSLRVYPAQEASVLIIDTRDEEQRQMLETGAWSKVQTSPSGRYELVKRPQDQ